MKTQVKANGSTPRVYCLTQRLLETIDWPKKEKAWFDREGRTDINAIASDLRVAAPTVRNVLEKHYGPRVEFRRGRNGGTFLSPPQSGRPSRMATIATPPAPKAKVVKAKVKTKPTKAYRTQDDPGFLLAGRPQNVRVPVKVYEHELILNVTINPFVNPAREIAPVAPVREISPIVETDLAPVGS